MKYSKPPLTFFDQAVAITPHNLLIGTLKSPPLHAIKKSVLRVSAFLPILPP